MRVLSLASVLLLLGAGLVGLAVAPTASAGVIELMCEDGCDPRYVLAYHRCQASGIDEAVCGGSACRLVFTASRCGDVRGDVYDACRTGDVVGHTPCDLVGKAVN